MHGYKYACNILFEKWSNYETIIMASLSLDIIFSVSTPLSVYLQTKSLNYICKLGQWTMIAIIKIKF